MDLTTSSTLWYGTVRRWARDRNELKLWDWMRACYLGLMRLATVMMSLRLAGALTFAPEPIVMATSFSVKVWQICTWKFHVSVNEKTLKMDARRKWDILLPWGWRCSERPVHCWSKVHRISCLYEDYLNMQMRHCLIKDVLHCIRFQNRNLKHWTTLVSLFFSILVLQRELWLHLFMTPWIRKHCQQQWNIHLFCNVFGE